MEKIDLNSLPLAELIRIEKEIPKVIAKARKSEKKILKQKIEALAAESGFDLDELIPTKKPTRKVKAKYKNPADSETKWTGRGRKPLWVNDHLNKGGTLEDLLI